MNLIFLSNYFNHHEKPLCEALYNTEGVDFLFIQTEKMEEERVKMGWGIDTSSIPYVKNYADAPEENKKLVMDADAVIFGGIDDESYIMDRLEAGKLTLRYQESIYKEGRWKFVSPKGLKKKQHDHTRFNDSPVYLLCAGAYVAKDFSLINAYKGKKYVWGYFPEARRYDINSLLDKKNESGVCEILWSGRMTDWKHPELAIDTAVYLNFEGIPFHLTMAGGGDMEEELRKRVHDAGLDGKVSFTGFLRPSEIRSLMEKASVYLFTSSRKEGWGAVLNESMNSGCAVVASYDAGSVPFMVRDGENGFTFNNKKDLFKKTEKLLADDELRKKLGKNAYITVRDKWNAELAAERLSGWLLTGCMEVPELYLSESAPDWLKDIPAPMDMVSKEI